MRVLVRKELDVDKPVNLRRLKPVLKVYAGFITKWHSTKLYKTNAARHAEQEHLEQNQLDDRLKEVLLAMLYKSLTLNSVLKDKGKECHEVIVSVQNRYAKSLKRVLGHSDFLPYEIEYIQEQEDLRRAFRDMPILLRVKKKEL